MYIVQRLRIDDPDTQRNVAHTSKRKYMQWFSERTEQWREFVTILFYERRLVSIFFNQHNDQNVQFIDRVHSESLHFLPLPHMLKAEEAENGIICIYKKSES